MKDKNVSEGKKRKKHKKAPIIIAVIVAAVVVIRLAGLSASNQAGVPVSTTKAVRGDLQESISTSGTVESEDVRVIFAPVNGTLGEVNVEQGDAVKAGTLLVSYDMDQLERTMRQSQLQLEKSNAGYDGTMSQNSKNQYKLNEANVNLGVLNQQIEDNKAYLKNLQSQLEEYLRDNSDSLAVEAIELQDKLSNLTPGSSEYKAVSSELSWNSYLQQNLNNSEYVVNTNKEIAEVQERIAGYEEYKARMESQKSSSEATVLDSYSKTQYQTDIELAKLTYQEAEEDYNTAKEGIRAEFDGIVTACSAVPGQGVSAGMQLLTLQSSKDLKIYFEASTYDIAKLAVGQKADASVGGRVYHGEISKINRYAERNSSNTPMVGVEIHLLDADDEIILGMDAKLTIYTAQTENALLIPVEAINADKEGDFLYVVEEGTAVRRSIVCGISTDSYTEVLEGLSEEDVIILSSYSNLEEGMAVTVMP